MFTAFLVFVFLCSVCFAYKAFRVDPEEVLSVNELEEKINYIKKLKNDIRECDDGYEIVKLTKLRDIEVDQFMQAVIERERRRGYRFKIAKMASLFDR